MKKHYLSLLLLFGLLTPTFALTDICGISVAPDSQVAAFKNGDDVTVYIEYSTDEAAGVRIFARPFSNGSLSPGYAASGSPLYTGSGTAVSSFTFPSGSVLVDEIRIEVVKSDNSSVLRRTWVPVHFSFGSVGVNHFSYSDDPEISSFLLGENFTTSFQYDIGYPGGVRIFVRPYTNGGLTPGYSASGSGVYSGTGNVNANFTINSGKNVHVDELRVRITNDNQTVTVDEFFIPVNLYFSTVKITGIVPQVGNFPYSNESRTMTFDYSTTEAAGVRIFPRPWTNGGLTPNYSASGSGVYTGSGSTSSNFTITAGNQRVDHVRFRATNSDQSEVLLEMLFPVEYTFGNFLVENIILCPDSPARLENGSMVNVHYDYYNDEGMDTRIFVRPFTNGSLSPGYGASGSGLYATGAGTNEDDFTIFTPNNVVVDQLRFQVTNADQSQTLAEYFVPVHYVFGTVTVPTFNPEEGVQEVVVFPNPAADEALVSFSLTEEQDVKLCVTDLSGKLVRNAGIRHIQADAKEQWTVPVQTLQAGTYMVMLEGESFRSVKKLVVSK